MADEPLTTNSPKAIQGLVEEWSSLSPASRALDDLTPEQATTRLDGWPYSIAELLAHMLFWQQHDHETIATGVDPAVSGPAASWPRITKVDWPRLRDEFLRALDKSREIASEPETLNRLILGGKCSVGLRMVWSTGHNAYHLGQVVLMRRILGAWPPPGGGMD